MRETKLSISLYRVDWQRLWQKLFWCILFNKQTSVFILYIKNVLIRDMRENWFMALKHNFLYVIGFSYERPEWPRIHHLFLILGQMWVNIDITIIIQFFFHKIMYVLHMISKYCANQNEFLVAADIKKKKLVFVLKVR